MWVNIFLLLVAVITVAASVNVTTVSNDTLAVVNRTDTAMENIRVRVGHIGAQNAMPKAEAILEICRKELLNDGILNTDFDVEIISQMGCGESFEGVAVGADMYHKQNVKAFIGPYCNAELDAVSKMAAYWNVPIIGYMSSSNVYADKTIYKTQARVSLRTTNAMGLAVYALLKHYSWKDIAIVTNTGPLAFERTGAFEEIFHNRGITIVKKIMFDENVNAASIAASGYLNELKNSARVVICLFSSTRQLSKEFMQAVFNQGMNSNEFVFIFPWLQSESQESSPWIGAKGEILTNIKQNFGNAIIVDDVNGFNIEPLLIPFKQRIEANGISIDELNIDNLYGYLHLYDSLKLYALAARMALNETNNPKIVFDGRFLWNKMRRLTFPGVASSSGVVSGTVIMDDLAERAGIYAAFFVSPNRDAVLKVVEMTPYAVENCDGIRNKSGCFELNIVDIQTGFWPSLNSALPEDTPKCGFRNEKCDYTLFIIIGALALGVIIAFLIGYVIYRVCENRTLDKTTWRIFRDDMRVVNEDEMKSMLSVGSSKTKLSNMSKFNKHHAIIGTNTHASFHMYPQRKMIKFNREDMQTLSCVKAAVHDNLNPFLGMSFNEKDEVILLWKFCSRGTVQDIIYNDDVNLDAKFHAAFIRDITIGLDYLHGKDILYLKKQF
uniref:Receptor ligand binding region domain-containing protein n=1 Tax=Panagrolaimus davidi TaxID=227884 RepID=A0A914QE74_9BILA